MAGDGMRELIGYLVRAVAPRLACRRLDFHSWDGRRCRYCGDDCFGGPREWQRQRKEKMRND